MLIFLLILPHRILKYFSFSLKRVEHPQHGALANVSTTCPVGVNIGNLFVFSVILIDLLTFVEF